jgi:hypothetical protein
MEKYARGRKEPPALGHSYQPLAGNTCAAQQTAITDMDYQGMMKPLLVISLRLAEKETITFLCDLVSEIRQ